MSEFNKNNIYDNYFYNNGIHQLISSNNIDNIKQYITNSGYSDIWTYLNTFKHNISHDQIVELMCFTVKNYPKVLSKINYSCFNFTQDEINKIKNSV